MIALSSAAVPIETSNGLAGRMIQIVGIVESDEVIRPMKRTRYAQRCYPAFSSKSQGKL
jgi:hypothetical protein